MAKPDLRGVVAGTFTPHLQFDEPFLSMVVACIGTSLSAYIYTWQSNQEVEEEIAQGKRHWWQRLLAGATAAVTFLAAAFLVMSWVRG